MVRRVCKRAGVRQVGPHALRHGFAVRYLRESGRDSKALQELMGHVDSSTTDSYLDALNTEELEQSWQQIDEQRRAAHKRRPSRQQEAERAREGICARQELNLRPGAAEEDSPGGTELEPPLEPGSGVTSPAGDSG
jgi:hypothetical protein